MVHTNSKKETAEAYMLRALALAERGRLTALPNPLVGCVIVKDQKIVGEGWHERPGTPHAEVHALRAAGTKALGATAYVTLEPCNHQGRTPPCTEALIEAGIKRVVVAARDPNPMVNGQGVKRLQSAGIEVSMGLLEDKAEAQNEIFRTVQEKNRPFVLYKTAMTLDGKLATRTGQSRWITGQKARDLVQAYRNELDVIAVGINTVLLDDPQLTCRLPEGTSPTKVIFDSVARTPLEAKLFEKDQQDKEARVIIYTTEKASAERVLALQERGAEVVSLPSTKGRADIEAALKDLAARGLSSVLLEGGGTLAWSFFDARAVDKVAWFIGPKLLGGAGSSPLGGLGVASMAEAISLAELNTEVIGEDLLITGKLLYPKHSQSTEVS